MIRFQFEYSDRISILGTFSELYVSFKLKRHMGYFMINVYVPCSLLVIISFVGFWINREATADRISLGEIYFTVFILHVICEPQRWGVMKQATH